MAASPDWPWQSLSEAAAAIKAGAVSPIELTRACLERIERVDRVVHAFVSVDAQGALQDAAKAEREIKAGHYRGPLHGIPIGLKDNYDTTGVATRNGSRVFADRMPTQDATTWARLREAGAVLLGKTTMSEAAMGRRLSPRPKSVGRAAEPGPVVRRVRRRRGRWSLLHGHGVRHRRVHPDPGRVIGSRRVEGHVRARLPRRRDAAHVVTGSCRTAEPTRRGRRARARRDRRARPAGPCLCRRARWRLLERSP